MSVPALMAAMSRLPEHRARMAEHARGVVDVRSVLLVHFSLCDRYVEKRGYCDQTNAQLAAATGEHERIVRRSIAVLDACGLWSTTTQGNQHRGARRVPTFVSRCGQTGKQRPLSRPQRVIQQRPVSRPQQTGGNGEQRPVRRSAAASSGTSSDPSTVHLNYSNYSNLPTYVSGEDLVRAAEPFTGAGNLERETAATEYVDGEAKRQLAQHAAREYGQARHPTQAAEARARAVEAVMPQALEWLRDGRRPYDIARAIAARAAGDSNARPPTRAELGLEP